MFFWVAKLRRQIILIIIKIGELSTEEMQEITDNAIPVQQRKKNKIKFGMRIINGKYLFKFPLKAVKFQT